MAIPSKVEEMEKQAEEILKKFEQPTEDGASNQEEGTPQEQGFETTPEAPQREDWKQKYLVLKGKYDAEVPRLQDEVKNLTLQVQKLLDQNTTIMSKLKETETVKVPDFNNVDLNEFKEEYPEIYKAMNVYFNNTVAKYEAKIKELEEKLENTSKMTETAVKQDFYLHLERLVPDWETINSNPEFVAWVNEIDPFTGYKRYDLLMNAFNNSDAKRVSAFFNKFKEEKGISSQKNDVSKYASPSYSKSGTQSKGNPRKLDISLLDELNKEIKNALAMRNYKLADELEKKMDAILANMKT